MKTAVIYARYSSDKQTEQSIEGQVRVCQDYANRNSIVIVDKYIDRAVTGTNDNRKDFQRMLKDSAKRKWDYVLVYKLDRFSRDQYETVIHKKTLKDNGVKLISVMENIPDSPEGALMESVIVGINQYYSAELRQKVNRGLYESWMKGNATGGGKLIGYDIINKKFVINEKERKIINLIFTKYAQGYTAHEIADDLNDHGFVRPTGQYFTERYIFHVLHKQHYNGKTEHRGQIFTNIYPQIINDNLWEQVQALLEKNKHSRHSVKSVYNYILSGKLVCGLCNEKMTGVSGTSQNKTSYYYYICNRNRHKPKGCDTKQIAKEYIEDLVIDTICKVMYTEENLIFIVNKVYDYLHKKITDDSNLAILENKKKETARAIQNIVKAIEQGIISDFTQKRLNELEVELNEIETKINNERNRSYGYLEKTDIEDFLRSHLFTKLNSVKVRKALINSLVKEIRLYPNKIIVIFNIVDKSKERLSLEKSENMEQKINNAIYDDASSFNLPSTPPYVCLTALSTWLLVLALPFRGVTHNLSQQSQFTLTGCQFTLQALLVIINQSGTLPTIAFSISFLQTMYCIGHILLVSCHRLIKIFYPGTIVLV